MQGTVVGGKLPVVVGMQGGSDVGGPVVPVPGTVVDVPGKSVVEVVVAAKVVVVVPGVGPVAQPKDWNSDVKIAVTAGRPANELWSDVSSWHTGCRMEGSS